jgi:hypothetical protein
MFSGLSLSSNPFKGIKSRFTKGIKSVGQNIISLGPTPIKSLRNALLLGNDENTCIEIYSLDKNGYCLLVELNPSLPFPTNKKEQQDTPLHLASLNAFKDLLELFLQHGGTPNTTNSRNETCFHSVS